MSSVRPEQRQVNVRELFETTLEETRQALLSSMGRRMMHLLDKAVDHLLGRERYERRGRVSGEIAGGQCLHCHTRQSNHFSRHGGRMRTATTWWGDLQAQWPRARCQCGHCIQLNLQGWLEPSRRLGEDVDVLIQRLGALGISLRQMAKEFSYSHVGPLGLRTLNQRLHQLQELIPGLAAVGTPHVLLVDGIDITQLRPNGEVRQDRKGRQRGSKVVSSVVS